MKKIIAIATLALGVLVWRMGAMDQQSNHNNHVGNQELVTFRTSDHQRISVDRDRALFFGTVNDLIGDTDPEDSRNVDIRLPNVTRPVLNRILGDLDWVIQIQYDALREGENDIRKLQRWVNGLQIPEFSLDAFRERVENLNAASFLRIPALEEKYAKEIAGMLCSDAALQLLYGNNSDLIDLLSHKAINLELRAMIYEYLPHGEIWIELHVIQHALEVCSADFSPSGKGVVTASDDGCAKIVWQDDNNRWQQYVIEGTRPMKSAHFSSDGTRVSTILKNIGHHNVSIVRWDGARWQNEYPIPCKTYLADFSPDGARVIISSDGNTAKIARLHDTEWQDEYTMNHHNLVHSVNFSRNGNKVITASWDNSAKIASWDGVHWQHNYTVQHDMNSDCAVNSALFSEDESKVITASDDKTAKIAWQDANGHWKQFTIRHDGPVYSAVFSRDGNKVVTASQDKTAKIVWQGEDGELKELVIHHNAPVNSAVFSRDGSKVVTASDDGTAKIVWQGENGEWQEYVIQHAARVNAALFARDSSDVVTASDDGTAKIVSQDENGYWHEHVIRHADCIRSAKFSPDGRRLVTASRDKTSKIWTLLRIENFTQALFVQVLQWARMNHKPMIFGTWMKGLHADSLVNIEKTFGPFTWRKHMHNSVKTVVSQPVTGKKRVWATREEEVHE